MKNGSKLMAILGMGALVMGGLNAPTYYRKPRWMKDEEPKTKYCGWCGEQTHHPNGACSAEHFKLWKASGFKKNHSDPT